MASEELQEIVETLKGQGKMHFLPSVTEDQITMFEKTNDVTLPKQYREWLQCSDGGNCFLPAGVQFYGVAHKPLIDVADDDRPNDNYVVIGTLASGDPIVFERNKEAISIYNHEAGRIESDETFKDFFSFLKELHDVLGIGG